MFLEICPLYSIVIIIAHRLNTVKSCDGILLLNKGQSSAPYTFDALIEYTKRCLIRS